MLITEAWQNKEVLEMLTLEIMYFNFLRSILVPIKLVCCDWILITMDVYCLEFQSLNKTSQILETSPHTKLQRKIQLNLEFQLTS